MVVKIIYELVLENLSIGAGEVVQWLRVLTALPKDPGSIPSICMAPHNCMRLQFQKICEARTDIHKDKNTNTYKIKINKLKKKT